MGFQHLTIERRRELGRKGGKNCVYRYLSPERARMMGEKSQEFFDEHPERRPWNEENNQLAKLAGRLGGLASAARRRTRKMGDMT